ncbi:MAG: MBL fold metallo-hydrolase [Phycisphaera sp.]|nr:MBL fold metallo-hydrolase [Phycisphaera sp.]
MLFEQIAIGGNRNFAYLFGDADAGVAAAVDVGYSPEVILDRCVDMGLELTHIFATHSHYDHVDAVPALRAATGAVFVAYRTVPDIDLPLDDGDVVRVGSITVRAIHCPGHSPDSIALLLNDAKLISGDELFVGKIGGTAHESSARQQYHSLHQKLMTLDDAVEVWPGHDFGVSSHSTIGAERAGNPFLTQPDFDAFWHLKKNWNDYKREHGIK